MSTQLPPQPESEEELRKARERKYGSPDINQDAVGMVWTGILMTQYQMHFPHPIPGYVVALMMAALKETRSSTPVTCDYSEDSYTDAGVYIKIAKEQDPRNPEKSGT